MLYIYLNGFSYLRMGYAAAISLVLFVIIMTLIQLCIGRSEEATYV